MDPLSVTLAVISLTTAIKDLVELGQKIHESFAKVPNNFRNARRAADEIKEMLEEIKTFCEDHKDMIDNNNMKEFHVAVQGLLAKFRAFETSILPLVPKAGGRRRDRLLRSWDAWRNNNKVEGTILELQSEIVKVMRRYMMKSTMRTEVKLESIHQETTRGLEVLDVVRRDVSALRVTAATTVAYRSSESSGRTSDEFNRNVIMFARSTPSTSVPMLRTPEGITEEIMTTAYIKIQINSIATTVEKMSMLPASAPNSVTLSSIDKFHWALPLEPATMSIMHLRHHVVRQVTNIRDLLDTDRVHTISIHNGATELNHLATGLATLRMNPESILIRNWAVMLARALFDASSGEQPDLAANLAHYLLSQCQRYVNSGNRIRGLQSIKEAYTIIQNLRNQHGQEARFQILFGNILLEYAQLALDNKQGIEMTIEAVGMMENILRVQAFNWSKLHDQCESVVQPSPPFLDRLLSSAPMPSSVLDYASALQRLGGSLFRGGYHHKALGLQLLGIAIRQKMVSAHGHVYKAGLACAISLLVRGGTAIYIPAERVIDMIDECILLFRELAEKNPPYYARQLVNVLWVKAKTLEKLNQGAEAVATWEEITGLAGQIVQDSKLCANALHNLALQFRRLKKHDDAVRTGTLAITTYQDGAATQALRYLNLSEDLWQLRRFKESAEAAQTSVPLYRRLAMNDPGKWTSHLSAALAHLARCMAILGDSPEALIAWQESVNMVNNYFGANPDSTTLIGRYYTTLYIHPLVSLIVEDQEKTLEVSSTATKHLRRLSEIYAGKAYIIRRLLWTESCHAYNMLRLGRLLEAQQYIARWFDVWSSKPESILDTEMHSWHGQMANLKAEILDAQGSVDQALLANKKVQDIARLPFATSPSSAYWTVKSAVHEAQLHLNLGHKEEALKAAERALQLSRENKPTPILRALVFALHVVAHTSLLCQDYGRTIDVAREGHNISAGQKWQNIVWEYDIHIPPSLLAIRSSAEANLGRHSIALEYAQQAVEASLHIRDRKANISATAAKGSYIETRGNLADVLLVTGDLEQARQIYEERRDYFSKRVESRMGEYRELAPILRGLGVLCCSAERHEEGEAAAQELTSLIRMLGNAFPSLQEQVKVRLRNQAMIPILKILDDMTQNLDCGHQADVVSLFAI